MTKCKDCEKGRTHYHDEEVLGEFVYPATLPGNVCTCGRVDPHYHKQTRCVLIEGNKE